MSITRPKTQRAPVDTAAADAFISGAPDAVVKPRGVKKGNRQQISLTIAPGLLEKVDALAAALGQSRAAVINMAVYRAVEHGLTIEALRKS